MKLKYLNKAKIGGGAINEKDYKFIVDFVNINNFKTIGEFGPGSSTYAFLENNCKIKSYENNPLWLERYKEEFSSKPNVDILKYSIEEEKIIAKIKNKVDMFFIDSPPSNGKMARLKTCLKALQYSDVILLHDAKRREERQVIEKIKQLNYNIHVMNNVSIAICHSPNIEIKIPTKK